MKTTLIISAILISLSATAAAQSMKSTPLNTPKELVHTGGIEHPSGVVFPPEFLGAPRSTAYVYNQQGSDMSAGYEFTLADNNKLSTTVYVYPWDECQKLLQLNEDEQSDTSRSAYPGFNLIEKGPVATERAGVTFPGHRIISEHPSSKPNSPPQEVRSSVYVFCPPEMPWAVKFHFSHLKDVGATELIDRIIAEYPLDKLASEEAKDQPQPGLTAHTDKKSESTDKPSANSVITLKNGDQVEGTIIERTDEHVIIEALGVELTYYTDEIESITE